MITKAQMKAAKDFYSNYVDFKVCPKKEYTEKVLVNDSCLAMIDFSAEKSKEMAIGFQKYLTDNYNWESEPEAWFKKEINHEGTVAEEASAIYPLYLEHLKQQSNGNG